MSLITDGRFSGATRGAAIGHVSPEAARGGPIALVEEGDIIAYDVEKGVEYRRQWLTGSVHQPIWKNSGDQKFFFQA